MHTPRDFSFKYVIVLSSLSYFPMILNASEWNFGYMIPHTIMILNYYYSLLLLRLKHQHEPSVCPGDLNKGQFAWNRVVNPCTTVSPTASYLYLYTVPKKPHAWPFNQWLCFCFRHVAVLTLDCFSSFVALVTWSCFLKVWFMFYFWNVRKILSDFIAMQFYFKRELFVRVWTF